MNMDVCIATLKDYKENGFSSGEWYTLPNESKKVYQLYQENNEKIVVLGSDYDAINWRNDVIDILKLASKLASYSRDELLELYYEQDYENRIYHVADLIDVFYDDLGIEINLENIQEHGDYNPNADYFYIDAYNHFVSLTDEQKEERENMYLDDLINDML